MPAGVVDETRGQPRLVRRGHQKENPPWTPLLRRLPRQMEIWLLALCSHVSLPPMPSPGLIMETSRRARDVQRARHVRGDPGRIVSVRFETHDVHRDGQ